MSMTESFSLLDVTTGVDLTPWIISYEWSGDLEQAGRKLNFKIAYTTKDNAWTNPTVKLGDEIMLYCIDQRQAASLTFPRENLHAEPGKQLLRDGIRCLR